MGKAIAHTFLILSYLIDCCAVNCLVDCSKKDMTIIRIGLASAYIFGYFLGYI